MDPMTAPNAATGVLMPTESPMPLDRRIDDLVAGRGFTRVDAANADAFASADGDSVLLLTAEPRANPESWDAAVILPELLRSSPMPVRAGIADPVASKQLAVRYGVRRYPALVFQRGGGEQTYVDALEGLCDWEVYRRALEAALARPTARPPSIGIAVVGLSGDTCH